MASIPKFVFTFLFIFILASLVSAFDLNSILFSNVNNPIINNVAAAPLCTQDSDCGQPSIVIKCDSENINVLKIITEPICYRGQCQAIVKKQIKEYCEAGCSEGECLPFCGDGDIEGQEECDDGNQNNSDLCSNQCQIQCIDSDNDGVCDPDDECPDTPEDEPVDEDGCDIIEFCENSGFSCGIECFKADWRNNEPGIKFPQDCTVVVPLANGVQQQPKCVPTEFSPMCAN